MATYRHPITGVALNQIEIERTTLTFDEAVTAHVMRRQGERYHIIAQKLGTNTGRLGEVFNGDVHPKAAKAALRIVGTDTRKGHQAEMPV